MPCWRVITTRTAYTFRCCRQQAACGLARRPGADRVLDLTAGLHPGGGAVQVLGPQSNACWQARCRLAPVSLPNGPCCLERRQRENPGAGYSLPPCLSATACLLSQEVTDAASDFSQYILWLAARGVHEQQQKSLYQEQIGWHERPPPKTSSQDLKLTQSKNTMAAPVHCHRTLLLPVQARQ